MRISISNNFTQFGQNKFEFITEQNYKFLLFLIRYKIICKTKQKFGRKKYTMKRKLK